MLPGIVILGHVTQVLKRSNLVSTDLAVKVKVPDAPKPIRVKLGIQAEESKARRRRYARPVEVVAKALHQQRGLLLKQIGSLNQHALRPQRHKRRWVVLWGFDLLPYGTEDRHTDCSVINSRG
jgi:hypothetical protein